MTKVCIEELSKETFWPFGFFMNMIHPTTEFLGGSPVTFFRDTLQLNMNTAMLPSFSVCKVEKRPLQINMYEYHSTTGEGILPLDNDIAIHVIPATRSVNHLPLENLRVFRVPMGTMVVLRPGVWHHAPFTLNDKITHVLIVLPERTYANDCIVKKTETEIEITGQTNRKD